MVLRDATLSSSKPFTIGTAGALFSPSSPSLSLFAEEEEDEDEEEDDEPDEQDEEEDEELEPEREREQEEDEDEEEDEEREDEQEDEPSESEPEPPRAARQPLLPGFLCFLEAELFGVRGSVRAATIRLSPSSFPAPKPAPAPSSKLLGVDEGSGGPHGSGLPLASLASSSELGSVLGRVRGSSSRGALGSLGSLGSGGRGWPWCGSWL